MYIYIYISFNFSALHTVEEGDPAPSWWKIQVFHSILWDLWLVSLGQPVFLGVNPGSRTLSWTVQFSPRPMVQSLIYDKIWT